MDVLISCLVKEWEPDPNVSTVSLAGHTHTFFHLENHGFWKGERICEGEKWKRKMCWKKEQKNYPLVNRVALQRERLWERKEWKMKAWVENFTFSGFEKWFCDVSSFEGEKHVYTAKNLRLSFYLSWRVVMYKISRGYGKKDLFLVRCFCWWSCLLVFFLWRDFLAGSRRSILLTKNVAFVSVIDHVGNRGKEYLWDIKNSKFDQ